MTRLFATILALPLVAGLAGCEGDDNGTPTEPTTGTFSATVSGAINEEIDGVAFFGESTDPETGETGWVLWLSTSEQQSAGNTLYFFRLGDRPGTGTYPLADLEEDDYEDGDLGALYNSVNQDGSGGATFISTGGTLTVSASSSGGMEGSFDIQAFGTVFSGGTATQGTVTIEGSYDAIGGTVGFPGF